MKKVTIILLIGIICLFNGNVLAALDIEEPSLNIKCRSSEIDEPSPIKIEVLSPNGGEEWVIGNTYNITWAAKNIRDELIIFLRDDRAGPSYKMIANGIPASSREYSWEIPDDFWGRCFQGNTYKIQVRELFGKAGTEGVFDESDNYFRIVPEPATMILLGLGAIPLIRRRHRR